MIDAETTQNAGAPRRRGRKQLKLLVGSALVLLVIGYLIMATAWGSAAYYLTVAELLAQQPVGRNVRVAGNIVAGSIQWDERELRLSFDVADATGTLPVVYVGPRPDMFRDDAEVVVEGKYEAGAAFQASTLMLKCPSKYEEAANG